MATKLVTNNQKIHTIRQFIESIDEVANSVYYLFTSDHIDDLTSTDIFDCNKQIVDDVYSNMIVGKRVSTSDVAPLINRYSYTSNTVYSMYDDSDIELRDEQFYVMVDEGSYSHVYKCLDNNNDSPSVIQPTFAHISGANADYYKTSDGYIWKYMYTFDVAANAKFGTEQYMPVIANNVVTGAAISSQIDIVKVTGEGRKYDNYLVGVFGSQDINYGGNSQVFQIANTIAKNSNGFYTDCVMYLSVGSGAGQHKIVQDYVSNSSGKFVILESRFDPADQPTNGTEYQIYPQVTFKSAGHVTVNAAARALVNALASNSIYRIEMLEKGSGYDYHTTANVIANSVVGVQANALLDVISSPPGGHGFDAAAELYASRMEISVKLSNTESNTIPSTNKFSQIGLIKDPMFRNVGVECDDLAGVFLSGEAAYKLEPYRIADNCISSVTANTITVDLDPFNNGLTEGDMLYLVYETADIVQLANIVSIVNTSTIQMTANAYTSATDVTVYKANPSTSGVIIGTNTTYITFDTINGIIKNGDLIVGSISAAKTIANSISLNNIRKGFDTYVGMYSISGNIVSGSFTQNETVYQTDINTANAKLHSIVTDDDGTRMYITNQQEIFHMDLVNKIIGGTSNAMFSPAVYHSPDIKFGTGQILFLENISPVTRSANTNEQFQVIFEY